MLANSVIVFGICTGLSFSQYSGKGAPSQVKVAEWQLLDSLFTNYSKITRPSLKTNISVNLVVSILDSVDSKKEKIGLRVWFRMFWTDYRLKWNTSQFNITSLTVNFDDIWTPDVVLYSAVGTVRSFGISSEDGLDINVIIYSDGLVFFTQPTTIQSACAMNIAHFPFDDQMCELTFGSWSMDLTMLGLKLWKGGIDLSDFTENNMWRLLDISAKAKDEIYTTQEVPFSVLIFTIGIRRKALFYIVNFIAPPVTILLLSLLLFLIPPEVGKRMEAGINLLLSLSVYLLLVNSKMPSTSTDFPLLTKFYACAIIILVLAMCCTCVVYAMYFMNSSGLQTHDSIVAQTLRDFVIRWLKPLPFGCPCRLRLTLKSQRSQSKVQPLETDFNPNKSANSNQGGRSEIKPSDNHEQDATTSQDPSLPVVIKSDTLPWISAGNSEDTEEHLVWEEKSSGDLSSKSSISSIFSFKSHEDFNILTKVYFTLPSAENNTHVGVSEKGKKVTFYHHKTGTVKRRATIKTCDGSVVKQTEHTLLRTAGSSWFSQSSCEEFMDSSNGNEETKKMCKEISPRLSKDVNFDTSNKKDSTSDDQGPDLFSHFVYSFDAESSKILNMQQWRRAAMALDRMFIIVLFISIMVSFSSCLLLAPRVRQSFSP